jgi:DNA (cytosine-5)-methyltransferase 1
MENKPIRVAELFAGVGGFRLGLEGHPDSEEDTGFKVVFSNQWEPPGTGKQWASKIYEERFGPEGHTNVSIHDFTHPTDGIEEIDDHDVLVGGFPCQDYSVARTVSGELGIKGEKGKLWVDISRIIRHKRPRPKVVLLENVPRLLNSPSNARGLNFTIILNELLDMGYHVEWRVINAAHYGMPQQRSRVFILAYRTSGSGNNVRANGKLFFGLRNPASKKKVTKWILHEGIFGEAFAAVGKLPAKPEIVPQDVNLYSSKSSPFGNAGYAWKKRMGKKRINMFWSTKVEPDYNGEQQKLGDVLEENFDKKYEVDKSRIEEWKYAKGNKNEFRIRKMDHDNVDPQTLALWEKCMKAPFEERAGLWTKNRGQFMADKGDDKFYHYDEGTMGFDDIKRPSRTVVTAEIGTSPSRMRHIFEYPHGSEIYRRLSPLETERLNMFPDNWTQMEGIADSKRGFLMGNALVVGIIERLREPLKDLITQRSMKK